jgi:hypothetical protein
MGDDVTITTNKGKTEIRKVSGSLIRTIYCLQSTPLYSRIVKFFEEGLNFKEQTRLPKVFTT